MRALVLLLSLLNNLVQECDIIFLFLCCALFYLLLFLLLGWSLLDISFIAGFSSLFLLLLVPLFLFLFCISLLIANLFLIAGSSFLFFLIR